MRTLRVLMVGMEDHEIRRCEQILRGLSDDLQVFPVRFVANLQQQDPSLSKDFALIADRGDWAGSRQGRDEKSVLSNLPPVIALVDLFEPARVIRLQNSGARWVIPFEKLEELLPVCVSALDLPESVEDSAPLVSHDHCHLPEALDGPKEQFYKGQDFQPSEFSILNTINTIATVMDRNGQILFFNRYAEQVSGYSCEEVRGRSFVDLFSLPEEKRRVQSVFRRLVEERKSCQDQSSWLTRDGAARRIYWSNSVLLNSEGEVNQVIGIGIDITEQYSESQARQQLEDRFGRIFQASPTGIGIVRYKDGRFMDANLSLLSLLECTRDHLLAITPVEAGLLTAQELRELLEGAFHQGPAVSLERRVSLASRRSLQVHLVLEPTEWGDEPAFLVIVQDGTERWQAEEKVRKLTGDLERRVLERTAALQAVNRELAAEIGFRKAVEESSQRLIQIIWETPDVVGICNLDGYLLYVNKAGRRMFDLDETDPVGHISVYDIYPEDLRPYIRNEVSPIVERVGLWSGETEFNLPSGRRIAVSQVLLAHKDAEGKVIFFSTIARDISDQKRNSKEIELAYRREKELGILRTNFFSMTSHQFRTPLSAIYSSAELLEHYGGQWTEEKRNNHLHRIQSEIKRMTQLLDNILTLSRIESTSFDANFELVDLCDLIQRSVQEAEIIDGKKHTFRLNCVKGPLEVQTSPEIINRIFDNLFTNAIKYAPAGTPIETKLVVKEKEVEIEIQDHGIGIPVDEIGMVFQPFYRASNAMEIPGNGLGLLIVEKSLQLLGGRIQIDSKLGEGTRVVIQIPLRIK